MNTVHWEKEAGLPGGETPKVAAAGTVKRALDTPAATEEKNPPVCCRIALLHWSSSFPLEAFWFYWQSREAWGWKHSVYLLSWHFPNSVSNHLCNHRSLAVGITTSFEVISFYWEEVVPFYAEVLISAEILSLGDVLSLLRLWAASYRWISCEHLCESSLTARPWPEGRLCHLYSHLAWWLFPLSSLVRYLPCNSKHRKAELMFLSTLPQGITQEAGSERLERASRDFLTQGAALGRIQAAHTAPKTCQSLIVLINCSEGFFAHPKAAYLNPLLPEVIFFFSIPKESLLVLKHIFSNPSFLLPLPLGQRITWNSSSFWNNI